METLTAHRIEVLGDIRAFPGSRRLPHFNRESLEHELPQRGIEYLWMPDLGGRRKKQLERSPNLGLRNASFRNYADYMMTEPFHAAAAELVRRAGEQRVAIMCAERVYFHCHRMLVSDHLVAHGHEVKHITDAKKSRAHKPTAEGRMVEGRWVYPGLY